MSKDNKFKKDLNNNLKNTDVNSKNQSNKKREKAKRKLMDEYNLSEKEAEITIKKVENKLKTKNSSKTLNDKNNVKKIPDIESHNNKVESKNDKIHSSSSKVNSINKKPESKMDGKLDSNSSSPTHKQSFKDDKSDFQVEKKDSVAESQNQVQKQVSEDIGVESPSQDVDEIISDIIPDYNQHVSIKVKHVTMIFESNKEKIDTLKEMFIKSVKRDKSDKIVFEALDDVSFKIYKGEKVGIIGYNGAGKSTLLNIICGIYPPTKGEVVVNGNISPLLSLGAGFDYNYSGRKNILLNGAVLGYDKKFLLSKMDEIIEFSELGEFIDVPIKNYSSGMLAKLSFSIATVVKPDILVIDEVLSVGDVNFSRKSRDKIKSLMDGQTTVLLVSHSIPQIRELCDKAIWIENGKLKEIGEVNKVCDQYIRHAEKASNEQLANIKFK